MIDTDRTGITTRTVTTDMLAILVAWESKTITVDDACRALGYTRNELFALELWAVERGVTLARERKAATT